MNARKYNECPANNSRNVFLLQFFCYVRAHVNVNVRGYHLQGNLLCVGL